MILFFEVAITMSSFASSNVSWKPFSIMWLIIPLMWSFGLILCFVIWPFCMIIMLMMRLLGAVFTVVFINRSSPTTSWSTNNWFSFFVMWLLSLSSRSFSMIVVLLFSVWSFRAIHSTM